MSKYVFMVLAYHDSGSSQSPWEEYQYAVSETVAIHLRSLAARLDGGVSEGLDKIEKKGDCWYATWTVSKGDSEPYAHCPGGVYDDLVAALQAGKLVVHVMDEQGREEGND